jgi:hypothetical protein
MMIHGTSIECGNLILNPDKATDDAAFGRYAVRKRINYAVCALYGKLNE